MYLNNPEMLGRVQEHYPGAYAIEVQPRVVWVHCDPCAWNHRDIPGGTAQLGTNPATAALEREIRALVGGAP